MFKLFRPIEQGEFFVVFGDAAQGGTDKNVVQFMSKTRGDIPFKLAMHGAATEATPFIRQGLEYIHKTTKVKPVIGIERNMGGSSVMIDLINSNYEGHYSIYYMRDPMGMPNPDKPGWDTNVESRPRMLGEWLVAFNSGLITIYDQETIEQHQTFIVNKNGKPEAAPNAHDDEVMSCAGAWQLYQTENPPVSRHSGNRRPTQRIRFHV